MATKLLDHFLYIADAIYGGGQTGLGLWNDEDGFFYDKLSLPDGQQFPLKVRSLVGLIPLFAVETAETSPGRRLSQCNACGGLRRTAHMSHT